MYKKNSLHIFAVLHFNLEATVDLQPSKNNIDGEAAKISILSSDKIDKYQYLTDKEILLSNQSQITEQAKFTYFHLRRALEKHLKTTENQGQKSK